MRSLNENLWIRPAPASPPRHFTRYSLKFDLDQSHVLLLHGITGALDVLAAKEYELLRRGPEEYAIRDPATAGRLAARGYLHADSQQEADLKTDLVQAIAAQLPQRDAIFMLCPTDFCPMGCSYCFAKGRPGKARREAMSEAMIEGAFATIEQIRIRWARKVSRVVLYGGEPFQEFTAPAVAKIFELACRQGMSVAAFSNGLGLGRFKGLFADNAQNIDVISITLDGIGREHDTFRMIDHSFDRAVESIEMLIALGVRVQIKTNLNKRNIGRIPMMADFFRKKGWWDAETVFFELSPIQYQGLHQERDTTTNIELALDFLEMLRADPSLGRFDFLPLVDNKYHLLDGLGIHPFPAEKIPLYSLVPRIHNCPSYSKHMFVFGADGRFYLCNEEVGEDHACFGKCGDGRALDVDRMDDYFTRDVTALDGCDTCPYAMFCGGGCGHHAGSQERHFCGTLQADFAEIVRRYRDHILARTEGHTVHLPHSDCGCG